MGTRMKSGLAKGDRVVTSLERAGVKAGVKAIAEPAQGASPAERK